MSMRSVAFFVSEGFTPLTVNATLDTLTLTDNDASISGSPPQNTAATTVSLSLSPFDTGVTVRVGFVKSVMFFTF